MTHAQDLAFPKKFRSTLPHGERRSLALRFARLPSMFRSTLPHGERQGLFGQFFAVMEFRSTLPHGERQNSRRRNSYP